MSCDRYSDLWSPYFAAFFDHWSDCPFPVYLLANEREFQHPRVTTLRSGPDLDWSSSLIAGLGLFPHRHVLTLFEDLFFLHKIETARVTDLCNWAAVNAASYLRMKASPPPDEPTSRPDVGRVHESALYRTALHGALTERQYLVGLIRPGESAWHFEIFSPGRAAADSRFYSTFEDIFRTTNGVEKGLWYPDVLRTLRERGYITGNVTRGAWSPQQVANRARLAAMRGLIRDLLPRSLRPLFHRALWRWYRLTGKVR